MSETLIIGTTNPRKVDELARALAPYDIKVIGADEDLPYVEETGITAEENAEIKARAFSRHLDQVVLAMDQSLYFHGVKDDEQPGVEVRRRRVNRELVRMDNGAMLKHYTDLVRRYGGMLHGIYEYAFCIATPEGMTKCAHIIVPIVYVSQPCDSEMEDAHKNSGYPLEVIRIDPETGEYVSSMSDEAYDQYIQRILGRRAAKFIRENHPEWQHTLGSAAM